MRRLNIDPCWLREQYCGNFRTFADIAAEIGCSPSAVRCHAVRAGVVPRTSGESQTGRRLSDEHRRKLSDALRGENHPNYGKCFSDELRRKLSESHKGINAGEKHHFYGKRLSDDHRRKLSESHVGVQAGENHPLYGHHHSRQVRLQISMSRVGKCAGEDHPNWKGGKSFEPYCHKFNNALKEEIRGNFNRKCFICGELENGRKLCVHHVDYDKNTLCNGKTWGLIPLCLQCHAKTNFNRWHWFNLLNNCWIYAYTSDSRWFDDSINFV